MRIRHDDIEFVEIFPPVGIARVGDSDDKYFFAPEIPGGTAPIIEPPNDEPTAIEEFRFRDDNHKIKRQAVRFRVYAYDKAGEILGEINNDTKDGLHKKYKLTWTVSVANKKAAFKLFHGRYRPDTDRLRNPDVDPLDPPYTDEKLDERSNLIVDATEEISGLNSGPVGLKGLFTGSQATGTDITLGELRSDEKGRLVFLGGKGNSFCVADESKPPIPEIISEFDSIDWIDDICDGWVSVKVTVDPNK
jgi:hypothetical protein